MGGMAGNVKHRAWVVVEDSERVDLAVLANQQGDTPLHRATFQKDLYIPQDAEFGLYTLEVGAYYLEYGKTEKILVFIMPRALYFIFTPLFVWILLAMSVLLAVIGFIKGWREEGDTDGTVDPPVLPRKEV